VCVCVCVPVTLPSHEQKHILILIFFLGEVFSMSVGFRQRLKYK